MIGGFVIRGREPEDDMARVKHVSRRASRLEAGTQSRQNDTAAVREPATRSTEHPSDKIAVSIAPAAFPSLPTNALAPEPVHEVGQHGLWQRLDAHQQSNQTRSRRACLQVDKMYSAEKFPATLDAAQRAWYTKLKGLWLPNENDTCVSTLQSP